MKKYFIFFILSCVIFFFHALYTKHAIYGDGNGYYVYTQSLYFQRNLNFEPILSHLKNFQGRDYIFSRIFWPTERLSKGLILQNPFLIGTGIIWLPAMLFISVVNFIFNLGAYRFDLIYELGPGLSGIIFTIGGLFFLEKYLLNYLSKKPVFWTIIVLFLGTNIFYYTALEPALSHQPVFFLISFLLYWTRKFNKSPRNLLFLGLIFGLFSTVRIADSILLLPIIYQAKIKRDDFVLVVLGFLLAVTPQLVLQKLMFGTVFTHPYVTGQSGFWAINIKHTLEYLFSFKRGLFTWTPVLLIGLWGLIKNRSYLVLFSIAMLWIATSFWSGYLSAGFGQRFSFSTIPYFGIGIAYIFSKIKKQSFFIVTLPFILWNILLLALFYMLELGR